MPPRPPAKSGSPAVARTRNTATARKPFRAPRIPPASMTPRVCSVIGTPVDPIVILPGRPRAAIKAAKTAIWARSLAVERRLFTASPDVRERSRPAGDPCQDESIRHPSSPIAPGHVPVLFRRRYDQLLIHSSGSTTAVCARLCSGCLDKPGVAFSNKSTAVGFAITAQPPVSRMLWFPLRVRDIAGIRHPGSRPVHPLSGRPISHKVPGRAVRVPDIV